jgi:hypothetical protein
MPAPNSIAQYPSQWIDLVRAVAITGRSVTINQMAGRPLTKGSAAQMRFRFYHLRTVLRKDVMQQELYALSESVQVTLGAAQDYNGEILGWSITFSPRDKNAEALALQGALEVS